MPLRCKFVVGFVVSLSIAQLACGQAPGEQSTAKLVVARYRQIVLQQPPLPAEEVERFIKDLDGDGAWPDLNYADKHPSAWQPKEHLYRIRWFALALAAGDASSEQQSKLSNAFNRSLDHWLAKRYRCPNWWWNEIGTPQVMRDVAILLNDRLEGERRQGVLEVIGQSRVHGAGANLLWQAELAFHRGALLGDQEEMSQAADQIWEEIMIGTSEGVQTDWSFYQHGARPQAFGYGRSFLDIAVNLAWQLRDTPGAIPPEKREIVSNFLLEGLQWMSRGTYAPAGTFDRVIARKHSKVAAVLMPVLRRWLEVDETRRDEIAAFLAHQEGAARRPFGFRHFPKADFTAYHRPAGSIFLKTISTRTMPTESIIGENLKGKYFLSSGDHYIVRDGQEYTDLQPVLQWDRLPGLTVPDGQSEQERTQLVGGLGNGSDGMTAMNYVRTIDGKVSIHLRKAWFFHDDRLVCLMSDAADGLAEVPVVTSLEQCRLRGDVYTGGRESNRKALAAGDHRLEKGNGILHQWIVYLSLDDSPLDVYLGEARGSWSSISSRYDDPADSVEEKVLRVQLSHTTRNIPTGYALCLKADTEMIARFSTNPPWHILRNDRQCQAMRFGKSIAMAAFYEGCFLEADKKGSPQFANSFQVDQPCLAMWTAEKLWMCDPTNQGQRVTIIWNGKSIAVDLPGGGISMEVK